jgi:hypothetical protein
MINPELPRALSMNHHCEVSLKFKIYYENIYIEFSKKYDCREFFVALPAKGYMRYQNFLLNTLRGVVRNENDCDMVLNVINDVEKGAEPPGSVLYIDDVELHVFKNRIQFDIHSSEKWVNNSDAFFSLEELKITVTAWKSFLRMPKSLNSFVDFEISIEN